MNKHRTGRFRGDNRCLKKTSCSKKLQEPSSRGESEGDPDDGQPTKAQEAQLLFGTQAFQNMWQVACFKDARSSATDTEDVTYGSETPIWAHPAVPVPDGNGPDQFATDPVSHSDRLWFLDHPPYLTGSLLGFPLSNPSYGQSVPRSGFVEGTLLCTPEGEIAIEKFKPGDEIITFGGAIVRVKWTGRRLVVGSNHNLMPVRIRTGALGEGCPRRDLLVSPHQTLFFPAKDQRYAGVLVAANAMVNGASIVRVTAMPTTFSYHRLELTSGSLLTAEGVAADGSVDYIVRHDFEGCDLDGGTGDGVGNTAEWPYPCARFSQQIPKWLSDPISKRAAELFRLRQTGDV